MLSPDRWILSAVVAVGFLPLAASAGEFDEMRTWRDAGGRFELRATFVKLDGETVTLRGEDGREFEIGLDRLSAADRRFAERADENPFKPVEENPFKPTGRDDRDRPRSSESRGGSRGTTSEIRTIDVKAAAIPDVSPFPISPGWDVEADPQPGEPLTKMRPLTTPTHRDFFEKFGGSAVAHESGTLLLGTYHSGFGGRVEESTRLLLSDLRRGKVRYDEVHPGSFLPLAVSPRGERAIVVAAGTAGTSGETIEVWDLDRGGINPRMRSEPYKDAGPTKTTVEGAWFVDGDRFLTVNGANEILIWDANAFEPTARVRLQRGDTFAVSPGGRYLVAEAGEELLVVDLEAGDTRASLTIEDRKRNELAFSPSGRRLVAVGPDGIEAWDFESGDVVTDFRPAGLKTKDLLCLDDTYVMVGESLVVDLDSRLVLWEYTGSKADVFTAGGFTWMVVATGGRDGREVVYGGPLPHPAAVETLANAVDDPELFVLRPQMRVRIDVAGVGAGVDRRVVEDGLREALEGAGFVVSDEGPVVAAATVRSAGSETSTYYRTRGRFPVSPFARPLGKGTDVSMPVYERKLELRVEGEEVWSTSGKYKTAPWNVSIEDNESISQALAKYRDRKPDGSFFKGAKIPQYVQRQTDGKTALGTSAVTATGIR